MKSFGQHRSNSIEFSLWQFFALLIGATACLCSLFPLITQYRVYRCDDLSLVKVSETNLPTEIVSHVRHVRQVSADQCSNVIPPMCLATTTPSTTTTIRTTTKRSTPAVATPTRPVITNFPTNPPTTTADPWASSPRPYNSWLLPAFAKPKSYSLTFSCPECFNLINASSTISFDGQVSIKIDVLSPTNFLVLHAKNLNISTVTISPAGPGSPTITTIPEFEMIHLNFTSGTIPNGEVTLDLTFKGEINQQEQTGFYRETFWTSPEQTSYVIATNFQPIYARRAFPCFDEPQFRADFTIKLDHPTTESVALSNSNAETTDATSTTFTTISNIATHNFAWAILPRDQFKLVKKTILTTEVSIWIRSILTGVNDENVNWAFEIVEKSLNFVENYLISVTFPSKIDLIAVPDLTLDEKASTAFGLLTFREEFLSVDSTLNSAERIQTTAKVIGEHIFQMWFSKVKWWNDIWFSKSLSTFLTYKMLDENYPDMKMFEQFAVREIVPILIDDGKANIWPVSNENLTSNAQIIDSFSPILFSKGAALLRLLERIVDSGRFQTAVVAGVTNSAADGILVDFYTSLNSVNLPGSDLTPEKFLQAWINEQNYPEVTIEFTPANGTESNTTIVFRQTRHLVSHETDSTNLNPNYVWPIYMECQFGGTFDGEFLNATGDVEDADIFLFENETLTLEIPNKNYQWIKCNKDFYSYVVTDYISMEDDPHRLWEFFDQIFTEEFFSANDRANLLNDGFVLSRTGATVTYDQVVELVRRLYNPVQHYVPWHVFIWHWNNLMGIEEHSEFFQNFKQFAQLAILRANNYDVETLLTVGSTHTEKLIRSMLFELLCRVQNTDALYKATELFNKIPTSYFTGSTNVTNVAADFLSTVVYFHLQNVNDIDQWDDLWDKFTENTEITAQKRQTFLRALAAAKEIWRLKSFLELALNNDGNPIETQEFFEILATISQNPIGRDIVWNFYRHNYDEMVKRFGPTNRLFNQLITFVTQSFENEFFYLQMKNFIGEFPSPSKNQNLALEQILINFEFFKNGVAKNLDVAISGGDKMKKKRSTK